MNVHPTLVNFCYLMRILKVGLKIMKISILELLDADVEDVIAYI